MTAIPMTHRAEVIGPSYSKRTVRLRELKLTWLTEDGCAFWKSDGISINKWPRWRIDIASIQPLKELT